MYPYRCEVASLGRFYAKDKKVYIHNIHKQVIDLLSEYDPEVKSLFFGCTRKMQIRNKGHHHHHQVSPKDIKIKISQNFEKVLMSVEKVEKDIFLLSRNSLKERFTQERMLMVKDKTIKKIITHGNDFYIVCCKDYDKDLEIISTKDSWSNRIDKTFRISVKRLIEPNEIRAFDLLVVN